MSDGLRAKYIVRKAETGEIVDNCFVLCPKKDWAARFAVRAYADITNNVTLRDDLLEWVKTFKFSDYDPPEARIDQSAIYMKPCPRCGGKGLIYREGDRCYYAECEDCVLELHDIYFSAEEAAKAWNYRQEPPNDPLTPDELREMVGEPVYITPLDENADWNPKWAIVPEDYMIVNFVSSESRVYILQNEDYGKTWLAYRRNPKEGHYAD